jgi:arsenate reductase
MIRWILAISMLLSISSALAGDSTPGETTAKTPDDRWIVFVCEHGSAKSPIAAAHFNAIAEQRGLPWRAVSRGTAPDEEMAAAAVQGLQEDGLPAPVGKPAPLTQADLDAARKVISFAVAIPATLQPLAPPDSWQVPPVSVDYASSRAAIVARIEQLLADLGQH